MKKIIKLAQFIILLWLNINLFFLPVAAIYSLNDFNINKNIDKQNIELGAFGKISPINNIYENKIINLSEKNNIFNFDFTILLIFIMILLLSKKILSTKYNIFLFALAFALLAINYVDALCCVDSGNCYPDANVCCTVDGVQGIGYVGCRDNNSQYYCPGIRLGDCLDCVCSDALNCGWQEASCGYCKNCSYDLITLPSYSSCFLVYDCDNNSICDLDQNDTDVDGVIDPCDNESDDISCTDSLDNDGDGYIDYEDPDCQNYCTSCDECGIGPGTCDEDECHSCGSCYFFYTFVIIPNCCFDNDSDEICDYDDNCPLNNNPLQTDIDNDNIGDICDLCPNIHINNITSPNQNLLCNGTAEINCTQLLLCQEEIINNTAFICNGTAWINENNILNGEYWINDSAVCCTNNSDCRAELINKSICTNCDYPIDPDVSTVLCEHLESGWQENCEEYETGCWDNNSTENNTKCCGDDNDQDDWKDSNNYVCFNGRFYTEPDDNYFICEAQDYINQGYCTHGYGCWDQLRQKCCGDDGDLDTWYYSTNFYINNILPNEFCYKGKWFNTELGTVTYYDITHIKNE